VSGVALTGATGFVGEALLNTLKMQAAPVAALARPRPGRMLDEAGPVRWVRGGLEDAGALDELAQGSQTFIHIAGATLARNPQAFHAVNAEGAARAAAAARKAGASRFILVSSLAARRPDISPYAASKAAGEDAVRSEAGAMDVVIVRPPAVLGPGDPALAPLISMLRRGLLPAPAEVSGGQQRMFSVIYVNDLARLLAALVREGGQESGLIEPCSQRHVSWSEIAGHAEALTGRRVRRIPVPAQVLHAAGWAADITAQITGRPLHMSSGKVRELLEASWVCDTVVDEPTGLREALAACLKHADQGRPARLA